MSPTRAGLGGDRDWPTSAALADLDNDGDLDLYVCHYLKWDSLIPRSATHRSDWGGPSYCYPRAFPAMPDHVFRNDGGRFVDVTEEAGIVDRDGRGLGVVAADLDGDGETDVFVANDQTPNYFWHNRGGFRFTEEGLESGLATNAGGGYLAGMGIACGDFDSDGRPDLAVTNFFGESTTLYHNHGDGIFSDRSTAAGLAASTREMLGFGLVALDANNDGFLDLVQANGHVEDYRPKIQYAMSAQLFLGDGAGKLLDVSNRAGAPWQKLHVGRGLAAIDLDNDGRVDLLLVGQNDPLALFHNQNVSRDHFLMLALEGTTSNRDAVGREWPSPLRVGPRSRSGSAVVVISRLPIRAFTLDSDRRGWSSASRSDGPRATAIAIRAWPRTPGTGCARVTRSPKPWPGSLPVRPSRDDRGNPCMPSRCR